MKKSIVILILLMGFSQVILSQDNSNNWKLIENNVFSIQIPNQNIRKSNNQPSILNLFLNKLNPSLAENIIDSISIQSGDDQIRCNLNISKSNFKKLQTDSIAPLMKKFVSDYVMSEFKNAEIESEISVNDKSTLILVSFNGIKEYMTIMIWFCNNYAISASLEDVSREHEKTKYLIESIVIKE